ncbi:MAG: GMC family oxidoreductase [Burkholderiales bacterium]|nr:GMC family oxidoreductase [Burkholderiales bacterium]
MTLVDIGRTCEGDRVELVRELRSKAPDEWDEASRRTIGSQTLPQDGQGPRIKRVFGSDFPYVHDQEAMITQKGTRCVTSAAVGGLSNVWGAAMLPFRAADLSAWPLQLDDLGAHYASVAGMVGLAGVHDGLESLFPFYGEPLSPLAPSRQASWVLGRMDENAAALRRAGLQFGRSRLAVRRGLCQRCQLCLTGCVYDAIYRTNQTLSVLKKHPAFRYMSGAEVLSCRDDGPGVTVRYRDLRTGSVRDARGTRAFVGAGVLSTAKIVARSLGAKELRLRLRYHPYLLIPMVLGHNETEVSTERLHALAQGFIEIDDAAISPRMIHLQMYTYSPLFAAELRGRGRVVASLAPFVLGRLVAMQAYLHSDDGEPVDMSVLVEAGSARARIILNGALSERNLGTLAKVRRKLWEVARLTGMVPIPRAHQIGAPGEGNHIGGTFPMSARPRDLESDVLGRVGGAQRLHVVDASVLPSLPSSTITFTAMANARRISEAAAALD